MREGLADKYAMLERQIRAIDRRTIAAVGETGLNGRLGILIEDVEELKANRPGLRFWLPLIISVTIAAIPGVWFLASVPDRGEVTEMISTSSPYVKERERILSAVSNYERDARQISATLTAISVQLSAIVARSEEQEKRWPELHDRMRQLERKIDRNDRNR